MSATLEVESSTTGGVARLRWKPIRGAIRYTVQWLSDAHEWRCLEFLEGDQIKPDRDGFLEFVDQYPGPMGHVGTYRVTAELGDDPDVPPIVSAPVALAPPNAARASKARLRKQLVAHQAPAPVKELIARLRWTPHGWRALLPASAGKCLDQCIEVDVQSPEVTDEVIDLLAAILQKLPRIAARAEKAFYDHGGPGSLDEEDQLTRPCIFVDPRPDEGFAPGEWAMIVGVKGSDYAWRIEFVRTRFKAIWAGD